MVSKLKFALVLAYALLAGCATSTKYAPTNPANNEKLRAAQISYQPKYGTPVISWLQVIPLLPSN